MRILHYAFSSVRYYRKRFFILSSLFFFLYGICFLFFAFELTQKAFFVYIQQMMRTLKNWVPDVYALLKKDLATQALQASSQFVLYFLCGLAITLFTISVAFVFLLHKRRPDFELFLRYGIHPIRIIAQILCEIWLAFLLAFACLFACSLLFQHSLFTKTQKVAIASVTQQDPQKIEDSILNESKEADVEQAVVIPYEFFTQHMPYLNDTKVNTLFFTAIFKSFAYFTAILATLGAFWTASYLSYLKYYPLKE